MTAYSDHLERHKVVYERHKNGEKYASIAKDLGISVSRARGLAERWRRELRQKEYPARLVNLPPALWDYASQLGNGDYEAGIQLVLLEKMYDGRPTT